MRILIAGIDGYLGWSLAQYLAARGHIVGGFDAFYRRQWVEEMGSVSAIPIAQWGRRYEAFEKVYGPLQFWHGDIRRSPFVSKVLREFEPDAIVHLAENPSAAHSMIDVDHAVMVMDNNVIGTLRLLFAMRDVCPDAHLVKLGTMGQYGTPNMDIPEGFFEVEYGGMVDTLPFPRQAGSWYHWTKVHDSNNIMFACKLWGLRSTDIMQGVVFGSYVPEMGDNPNLRTRLDFDEAFGTVINRYCCQAVIGHPLTPFGDGGQTRGFIPLRDSMQCLTLALENPPRAGEYRVFNQFAETYTVTELAYKVAEVGNLLGMDVEVEPIDNPRMEPERHYYNPDHEHLFDLGYRPSSLENELSFMLLDLQQHKRRIEDHRHVIIPEIKWKHT